MPLGRNITTLTVSLGATTSTVVTHGLSASPDFVWATLKKNAATVVSSNTPVFSVGDRTVACNAHTASVTLYNRGLGAGTWTVAIARFHSYIR